MNRLDEILAHKRLEVEKKKQALDMDKLRERITPRIDPRPFRQALRCDSGIALIAEIKRASPSSGLIREDFNVASIARAYEQGGAHALSILTDERFFQGQLKHVLQARSVTNLPCLRKDFVVDEYQVWEARLVEADAVLLIVAALKPEECFRLHFAAQEAGLDVLVEVHDEKELDAALEIDPLIIGINNRNLQTFQVDLKTTEHLAPRIPGGRTIVSESGIRTPDDVRRVRDAGVQAILVGESLMRQTDVEEAVRKLLG